MTAGATNTAGELEAAKKHLESVHPGVKELYLITSPTHISRVLRDACSLDLQRRYVVYGVPSQTSFGGTSPADVAVLEPPHRGDDSTGSAFPGLHELAAMMLHIPHRSRPGFAGEMLALLRRYRGGATATGRPRL